MEAMAGDQDINIHKISQMDKRLEEIERLLQSQQTSSSKFNSFIEQQQIENKIIKDQNQAAIQAVEIQDKLIQEQQKKISRIDTIEAILSNRNASPLTAIASEVEERSSAISNSAALSFSSDEIDLIGEYNRSPDEIPDSLSDDGNNVSIEQEAFARLWNGDDSNLTFKIDRKGNYLVIRRSGYSYLVPDKQRKIILQIYTTTKAIYNCEGYNEQYQKFRLIKPAIVSEESIDRWRITQKGILEFT